jgi:ABC-type cobalamin/Fe3+-siderophores transport system ATPase subunit
MHDLPLAFNFSDFMMVIDNGRLVAFDTPENIIKNDIVFELFGVKINKNDNGIYYTLLEK